MNKKAILISLTGIIFLLSGIGGNIVNAREIPWARGMRSEEVKALQSILKTDAEIYPEGYVTGYFGPLTEKAIKRLQKRYGILETGVIDEPTVKIIFPRIHIDVVSPNGGEIWDRNEIQTIEWKALPPVTGEEIKEEKYFWPRASIDLFRRITITPERRADEEEVPPPIVKSVFVRHIATVNPFDQVYSWKITRDIKNGTDYVIRISVGRKIIPIILEKEIMEPEEIWPIPPKPTWIYWDESDGTFEITGIIPPTPVPNLEEVIAILEKMVLELQKAISLLRGMAL